MTRRTKTASGNQPVSTDTIAARLVFVAYIGLILLLCFGNFDSLPKVSRSFLGIPTDKVVHFIMFFPFVTISYYATGKFYKSPWASILLILALFILGCVLAAATEIGQGYTSWRSADPQDFRADSLSLVVGAVVTWFIDIYRRLKK